MSPNTFLTDHQIQVIEKMAKSNNGTIIGIGAALLLAAALLQNGTGSRIKDRFNAYIDKKLPASDGDESGGDGSTVDTSGGDVPNFTPDPGAGTSKTDPIKIDGSPDFTPAPVDNSLTQDYLNSLRLALAQSTAAQQAADQAAAAQRASSQQAAAALAQQASYLRKARAYTSSTYGQQRPGTSRSYFPTNPQTSTTQKLSAFDAYVARSQAKQTAAAPSYTPYAAPATSSSVPNHASTQGTATRTSEARRAGSYYGSYSNF